MSDEEEHESSQSAHLRYVFGKLRHVARRRQVSHAITSKAIIHERTAQLKLGIRVLLDDVEVAASRARQYYKRTLVARMFGAWRRYVSEEEDEKESIHKAEKRHTKLLKRKGMRGFHRFEAKRRMGQFSNLTSAYFHKVMTLRRGLRALKTHIELLDQAERRKDKCEVAILTLHHQRSYEGMHAVVRALRRLMDVRHRTTSLGRNRLRHKDNRLAAQWALRLWRRFATDHFHPARGQAAATALWTRKCYVVGLQAMVHYLSNKRFVALAAERCRLLARAGHCWPAEVSAEAGFMARLVAFRRLRRRIEQFTLRELMARSRYRAGASKEASTRARDAMGSMASLSADKKRALLMAAEGRARVAACRCASALRRWRLVVATKPSLTVAANARRELVLPFSRFMGRRRGYLMLQALCSRQRKQRLLLELALQVRRRSRKAAGWRAWHSYRRGIHARHMRTRTMSNFHWYETASRLLVAGMKTHLSRGRQRRMENLKSLWFWKFYRCKLGLTRFTEYAKARKLRRDMLLKARTRHRREMIRTGCRVMIAAASAHAVRDGAGRKMALARKYAMRWLDTIRRRRHGAYAGAITNAINHSLHALSSGRAVDVTLSGSVANGLGRDKGEDKEKEKVLAGRPKGEDALWRKENTPMMTTDYVTRNSTPTPTSFAKALPPPRPLPAVFGSSHSNLPPAVGLSSSGGSSSASLRASALAAARLGLAREITEVVRTIQETYFVQTRPGRR